MPLQGECLCVCPRGLYFDWRETKPRLRAMKAKAVSPSVLADAFTVDREVTSSRPANPFVGFTVTPHFIAPDIQSPDVLVEFTNPLAVNVVVNAEYKKNGVNFQATTFNLSAGETSQFFPHADVLSPWLSTDVVTVTLVSIVPDVTVADDNFQYSIFPTTPPLSQNPVLVKYIYSDTALTTKTVEVLYNENAIPHDPDAPLVILNTDNSNDPIVNGWPQPVAIVEVLDPADALTGFIMYNPNPDNGGKAWLPIAWLLADTNLKDPSGNNVETYKLMTADGQVTNIELLKQLILSFAYANAGDDQNVLGLNIPGTTAYGGNVVYEGGFPNYLENMDKFYASEFGAPRDGSWNSQMLGWFISALKGFWEDEKLNEDAATPIPGVNERLYSFIKKFFDIEDARFFLPGGTYTLAEPGSTTAPATAPWDPALTNYITANGSPILLVMEILSIG